MKKRVWIPVSLLACVAAIVGGLSTFWTEYQWFIGLGYGSVYVTALLAQIGTGAIFGLIALAVLTCHVLLIRRFSKPRSDWTIPTPDGDVDLRELISKVSTPVVIVGAVAAAVAMGYWASLHWQDALKFLHKTPFGEREAVLGKDIGFYLFSLPLIQFAQEWGIYLMGGSGALACLVYLSRGAIVMKGRLPSMSHAVRGHMLVSIASILVVMACGYRIEMFEALFSKRGVAYGATYTDVHASLIAFRVLIGACLVGAAFLIVTIWDKRSWPGSVTRPLYALGAIVGCYALGVFAWPTVVQQFIVKPNELDRERAYLSKAIAGTRKAYGLDQVEVRDFPVTQKLTAENLRQNKATIDNIKMWDHRPLRQTYRQLQVIRLYYDFPNISVDRYRIGDNYWQVMLSARELVHSQLPAQSQTWVNQHLQYTHGYGICLSPVNKSGREGLPDFWVQDIPPVAKHPDVKVKRPEIYYGLESNNYVLVKTTTQEFDYPRGKENRYTNYQGKGGVSVGSFFRQLLFALRFNDVNLLFTNHITPESRILFNRSIQQRVRTLMPFLMLDQEPYITAVDGRLYWIQDAYTISYRYPYSQPTVLGRRKRINYVRNAVKVVIDAYHGSIQAYVWDQKDPLIATYQKIFPKLFRPRERMPQGLRAHVRYPKDLFTIQARMYESFHMTDPRVYYNQEDKWNIATELAEKGTNRKLEVPRQSRRLGVTAAQVTQSSHMSPYYMIMRLPQEKQEEFLLMVPFTPSNRQNMVAWMTARNDGEHYGKLMVYVFPKQKVVYGPMQMEARFDQDDHISQWITLRNQQGSTVIRGDLLVIPIEKSILYVEPIYLQATQTQLPELKQVIVAFGERLAMRPTLKQALDAVFDRDDAPADSVARSKESDDQSEDAAAAAVGSDAFGEIAGGQGPLSAEDRKRVTQLAMQAWRHFRESQDSLTERDWNGYGKHQTLLGKQLKQLSDSLTRKAPIQPKTERSSNALPLGKSDEPRRKLPTEHRNKRRGQTRRSISSGRVTGASIYAAQAEEDISSNL